MSAADPILIIAVVQEWVQKAENDLTNAGYVLKMGKDCPTDTVGFHAQQCAEKYIKAALIFNDTEFPKLHDLQKLVRLLPPGVLGHWALTEQRTLTNYAAMTRYPGSYQVISLKEARQAVRIARRVRSEIRQILPKAALRRPVQQRDRKTR